MSLKVNCRIRPPSSGLISVRGGVLSVKSQSFEFDSVFQETSSQKEVFDQTAASLIPAAMSGVCGCVIFFGPTE